MKGSPVADVLLKPGRDKAIRNRHPWIFSGAVERVKGQAEDGAIVTVRDHKGAFLARGYLNRRSQIVVRLLSWDERQPIDDAFWSHRIADAVTRRQALAGRRRRSASKAGGVPETTAYRLIHAEADRVPGLIVDRYGDFLVVQCLTLGIDARRSLIAATLADAAAPAGIYERSDVEVRAQEGLSPQVGVLHGDAPPPEYEIAEHGHRFLVDLAGGQKTGFYLDQRENRSALARYAPGREVLDAFAYSGGFSVYAARAGAGPITLLDVSAEALALAERNLALNGLRRDEDSLQRGDVFEMLRLYRDQGRGFDLIVLDPPKFAPTRRHVQRASRAYKDINLLALKLLRPGGILFSFSCSGGVDEALFQKIVFGAALDARREVQILERLSQGADHPVLLSFPGSAYLKGLVCRVLETGRGYVRAQLFRPSQLP
jgi:23S rRNA (cytosine1962-C5)-methyltransferase